MATDLRQIVENLCAFYDLTGKTVVSVGAGGGQLVEYARPTRHVVAVDNDQAALDRLAQRLDATGLRDKFTLIASDFAQARPSGDVVLFEFCLHEMNEPSSALAHARELAPDVVVIDHAPGSEWIWYGAEDVAVERSWRAVEAEPVRRRQDVQGIQTFAEYAELEVKMAGQGPVSAERIARYRGERAIRIPMPYRLALL